MSYHVRYLASVPLAFASYGSFLVFFTVSYRLSFLHPLAKYPGPMIAKSSKWWGAYVGIRGDLHLYYKSLHDRYGDVIRVGEHAVLFLKHADSYLASQVPTNFLFVTLPLYIRCLAKVDSPRGRVSAMYENRSAWLMFNQLGWGIMPGRQSLIDQRDPIMHMHQRKPWNRAFSSTSLKEYEVILAKRTRQLVSCLEDRVNGSDQKLGVVLDVTTWFSYFA